MTAEKKIDDKRLLNGTRISKNERLTQHINNTKMDESVSALTLKKISIKHCIKIYYNEK